MVIAVALVLLIFLIHLFLFQDVDQFGNDVLFAIAFLDLDIIECCD